jgi:hypothetical protein
MKIIEIDVSNQILAADKEKKTLNKPFRLPSGSKKKYGVYVKNDKGNIIMVKFGDPNLSIKRDDPKRRKSFRARHKCDSDKGPKWKARWWACEFWRSDKSVTDILKASENDLKDGIELNYEIVSQEYLIDIFNELKNVSIIEEHLIY